VLLVVLLAIFALPIGLPIAAAICGLIVAVFAILFALFVSFFALCISLLAVGVLSLVCGFILLFTQFPVGLFYLGLGLGALGLCLLFSLLFIKLGQLLVKGVVLFFNSIRKRLSKKSREASHA
jgi:uncharacterized membrane protein